MNTGAMRSASKTGKKPVYPGGRKSSTKMHNPYDFNSVATTKTSKPANKNSVNDSRGS